MTFIINSNDRIESFFAQNKEHLESLYPGIQLNRLKEELNYFSSSGKNDPDLFFNSLFKGVPFEYINGRAYFYSSEFFVNENVLIPRSETEVLVELVIEEVKKKTYSDPIRICDIGTGSGAILLSLAGELDPPINGVAGDISSEAIDVFEINKFRLNFRFHPQSIIESVKSDRFESISGQFDVIVSNPPYIKKSEKTLTVHAQVDQYEPELALYLPDDEYQQWFLDFFQDTLDHMNEGAIFVMEGHEEELIHLCKLAKRIFLRDSQVKIIKDYTQRDRFLFVKLEKK